MLAITTRYRGPTDHSGSRIVATCEGKRATVHYDSSLDAEGNHRRAVTALCAKFCWDSTRFYGGALRAGTWAWVPVFTYDWEQRQKEAVT